MVVGQRKTVQLEGARAQPFDFDLEEEPIAHAEEAADEEEENFFEELAQDFSRAQLLGGFSRLADQSRLKREDLFEGEDDRDEAKEDEYDYFF